MHRRLLRPRRERPGHHRAAEQGDEVAPFQTEASRASDRKNSIPLRRQETAALRNFDLVYVGFGVKLGLPRSMLERPLPPTADIPPPWLRAAMCQCSRVGSR